MEDIDKDSPVIYIFLSPSKDYNMYKSQGQRTKCNDFSIKCTCAMMVGQWSFWCTHASSSSFLSLSDRDCWKCKVENLVELSYLDLGAVLICRTCTPSPVVPLTKTALTPPFAKCLRQKKWPKDIKRPISVGLQNTRKIYEKMKRNTYSVHYESDWDLA